MPFSYLLKTSENVKSFKVKYNIPRDVEISYCHEDNIEDQRLPHVVFFLLMSILEGGVKFPVDPLLLRTFSFSSLSPDQYLPNFYRVVNCVRRLNRLYGLSLTQTVSLLPFGVLLVFLSSFIFHSFYYFLGISLT